MSDPKNTQATDVDKLEIKNTEIEPLSDEALENVAGGDSSDGCCSCSGCSLEAV